MITINVDRNSLCGYGRSGNVYRATYGDQQVAIKYCGQEELFDEIENEVRILKQLNETHCAFVPRLIHAYKKNGMYVVVTEFIDGKHVPLEQVPFEDTPKYEQALTAIHAHGILHGDLKDENFIISKGKVYVLDFGFARKANKSELDAECRSLRAMMCLPPTSSSNHNEYVSQPSPIQSRVKIF